MRMSVYIIAAAGVCTAFLSSASAAEVEAFEADRFVSSTGLATHLRFNNVYADYDKVSEALIDSGVGIFRDTGSDARFFARAQKLSDAGLDLIFTIHPPAGVSHADGFWAASPGFTIDKLVGEIGPEVVAFAEMNNELDSLGQQAATYWGDISQPISNDANSPYYFVPYIQEATESAWNQLAVSDNYAISTLPLIGPSFIRDSSYSEVGDLSEDIEYSNVHHYLYGWHPEVDNIRGIDHAVSYQAQVQSTSRGMITTEGGGPTASLSSNWPYVSQGRYMPRYFLAHWVKGFVVTTAYELLDEGTLATNQEQNFGLLENDFTAKPAYKAVANLLSLLRDPGPSFDPSSLNYTLSGSVSDVWTSLFQKRNGDYYLCIWLGLPSHNPATGSSMNVPSQSVSLEFPSSISSARIFRLDDSGEMSSEDEIVTDGAISFDVTDRVSVVRLSTAAKGGEPSAPGGLRARPADGEIQLRWSPTQEATGYTVWRAVLSDLDEMPNSSPNLFGQVRSRYRVVASDLTSTEFLDTEVDNGTVYHYMVKATNSGGESPDSDAVGVVPFAPIILDNSDVSGVTVSGSWSTSTSMPGFYGANYLHDNNTGGGYSIEFTPTLVDSGRYDVYLKWVEGDNRTSNVTVRVTHIDGSDIVVVNQRLSAYGWSLIGSFNLSSGTAASVEISNNGANGFVIADAVKFELTRPRPPSRVAASVGSDRVSVDWNEVTGAQTYSVKRAKSLNGRYREIARGLTAASYDDLSVSSNQSYYYCVSTVNAGGESVDSSPVKSIPRLEIIVDNADSELVLETGAWTVSSSTLGYFGTDYRHDDNTGTIGGKSFTFVPDLPDADEYKIYLLWTAESNRADNVPVDIAHSDGVATVVVDQTSSNGTWVYLGSYSLDPATVAVSIRNDGTSGFVIADAVKFVLEQEL